MNKRSNVEFSDGKIEPVRQRLLTQLVMRLVLRELLPEPSQAGWILRLMEFDEEGDVVDMPEGTPRGTGLTAHLQEVESECNNRRTPSI